MALETLANRYRPKEYKDVYGQNATVASLRNVIKEGHGHTFLLVGPSGTGKTTLARLAAAQAGCEVQGITEIDAATFTGIDDMRTITGKLMYRPVITSGNVAIILDECHMLSKAAWNSLLKSLEEPPDWVYWFLCTTDPEKVPPTIKTRCNTYHLNPVGRADLVELLESVARAEGWLNTVLLRDIIELSAKQANGSPRQALANLGTCARAKSREAAAELLKSAGESVAAIELARALLAGAKWHQCREILEGLAGENPESVRHVVRAYITKVILGSAKPKEMHFAILEAFSKPFPSGDGNSPLVLAVGSLVMGS